MNLGHKHEIRNVILPVLTIIGDGKSQDMMVGRYSTQHINTGHQMWMCNCTPQNADNHNKCCNWIDQSNITLLSGMALGFYTSKDGSYHKVMLKETACVHMKSMFQYVGDNVFQHLLKVTDCLQGPNESNSGIFRITPICGLHFIASGLGKNVVDTMLGSMSIQDKAELDRLSVRMFLSCHQSCRNLFPTPNLSKGITNMSKKTCDGWLGAVFYLGIVFRTGIGQHLLSKVIQKSYLADTLSVLDTTFIDMFKDHPAIENFGYMLECLSTYDSYNKKKGGYWNANAVDEFEAGENCLLNSIS